jgi:hypothetical protein
MRKKSVAPFPILPGMKPPPPDRLRPDMQKVWRDTVGRMPGGWFTLEMYPVLEEYCRITCFVRGLGQWLNGVDPTTAEDRELARYKFLSGEYTRLMALMNSLANRLRLTVSSQRDVRNSRAMMGTDPTSPNKPWDSDDVPARKN